MGRGEYLQAVLFDGRKSFWATGSQLEVTLVEHIGCRTIELIVFDQISRIEAPRQYVTFDGTEMVKLIADVGPQCTSPEIIRAVRSIKATHLLERIQMTSYSCSKVRNSWGITVVPKLLDAASGLLVMQCAKPADLVPAIVDRSIRAKLDCWEETMADFHELATPSKAQTILPPLSSVLNHQHSSDISAFDVGFRKLNPIRPKALGQDLHQAPPSPLGDLSSRSSFQKLQPLPQILCHV